MLPRLLALSLLFSMACSKSEEPANEAPTPQSPAQGEPQVEKEAEPPVTTPSRPNLAEADIKGLVTQWLGAQNDGDFAGYSASYAKRMTGIKRVGAKETTYDREGWLADRKRMFRKTMKVQSDDIVVRTSPTSAVVRFKQTWESGKFKDVGPKQLIVVREGQELRIAREEMLSSEVLSSRQATPVALEDLYFGADGIEGFVIKDADVAWARGPVSVGGSAPYIATRGTAPAKLPDVWKNLIGNPITVYQGDDACQDTVVALDIVVGVTPHFMYFQDENGEQRDPGDDELANDIFGMGTPHLVARTKGTCSGGVAQLDGKARGVRSVAKANDERLKAIALKAFRSSAGYGTLQKEFEGYDSANTGTWGRAESVAVFAAEGKHFAIVAMEGGDGCGDFEGAMTGFYEIDAKGQTAEVGVLNVHFTAEEAMDINRDGIMEFVGFTNNYGSKEVTFVSASSAESSYAVVHRFGWDYHDCPC